MNNEYTAIIKQDGDWWVGWIEETQGVNCQEATYRELLEGLKITLQAAVLIMAKFAVIPAWMPESSAMDGSLNSSQELDLASLRT
jgi:predicted RNase H-like HicB family nuclease